MTLSQEDLAKIVELAGSVPEQYQQKCFELLLLDALKGHEPGGKDEETIPTDKTKKGGTTDSISLPIDVRAFLNQYGLDENIVQKFYLVQGDQIRYIYQLSASENATRQTQHALMMCLGNAIMHDGAFEVAVEDLRERCKREGCYDGNNFKGNISKNGDVFLDPKAEPLSLSPVGKTELADLLETLLEKA